MRRGPKISLGLELAIPFALRRGHVMVFLTTLLNLAEFLITGNGLFVLVRVRLARRIRAGIADIESEFADAIGGLRLVPRSGPVSCELWLYSKHGILRYFRVENSHLVEIDCYGTPLNPLMPTAGPAPMTNNAGALPGPGPTGTAVVAAARFDPKSPIVRWLKKRNAPGSTGNPDGTDESRKLRTILESTRLKGPAKQKPGKNSGKNPGGTPARKNTKAASPGNAEIFPESGIPPAGNGDAVMNPVLASMPESIPVPDGAQVEAGRGLAGPAEGASSPEPGKSREGI
jgi:hypothetical protein